MSPDPCNPMTNNASLPTLSLSELHDDKEEPFSDRPDFALELYSSRISVDQDLSVIVAKIDNDDDVKQRLVPIVFHASVTQQRSSGSKTRISCSHVHERTNSCPPLQTRVREKGSHTN